MPKPEKLLEAIKKAQNYMCAQQGGNGSWFTEKTHNEPQFYKSPIIITSEAIQTLTALPDKEHISAISKGLNFLLKEDISANEPVDLCSWKLLALLFSNTTMAKKEAKKLAERICSEQMAGGYWKIFPNTFNLSNCYSVLALSECGYEKGLEKAKNWFLKTKAKDGFGWGFNNLAEESEVSFTCNVALALLAIGEDHRAQGLSGAKDFLESKQLKDGGWPSSKLTISNKSTTYATALALMALMQLSENPFNPKVEAGIDYLLRAQSPEGFWPLVQGEKKFVVYPNLYAVQALSLYTFLREKLSSFNVALLRNKILPQHLNQHIAREFFKGAKEKFQKLVVENIIDSRVLGSTRKAIERRKDILKILSDNCELDSAEIIDELKLLPAHQYLNKKSHLTQIKADMDFLRSLNVVYEASGKYFMTNKFFWGAE